MGILEKGIFGGFRNKTGPLVGVKRGNVDTVRSKPVKSSKPATASQLRHRANFGEVSSFLSYIKPLIEIGFSKKSNAGSAMNRAIAVNLNKAIDEGGTDDIIDYSKISYSQGKLLLPDLVAIEAMENQQIEFSWLYQDYENKWKAPDDSCTVLIYNKTKHKFVFQINAAARSDRFLMVQLPPFFAGDLVYAYISFNAIYDNNRPSNSKYIAKAVVI